MNFKQYLEHKTLRLYPKNLDGLEKEKIVELAQEWHDKELKK